MSNEIQLSNPNLPLQPALTPPQVLASAGQPEPTPLRRIHSLLRGRYVLATILAAIGAACGVAAGILLPKPAWESVGVVEMHPTVPGVLDEKVLPLYNQVVQNIMVQLHTERTIRLAMQNPQWKQLRPYPGDVPPVEQVTEFSKNLSIRQMPLAQEMIQVVYDDNKKDGKDVAQVAVSAVINAYHDIWETSDSSKVTNTITWLERANQDKQGLIANYRKEIAGFTKEYSDDAAAALLSQEQAIVNLEGQLRNLHYILNMAQEDRERRRQGLKGQDAFSPEDIARVDNVMVGMLNSLQDAETQRDANSGQLMANNPRIRDLERLVDAKKKRIADYAQRFNANYFIQNKPDGTGQVMVPKDLSTIQAAIKHTEDDIAAMKQNVEGVNQRHNKIEDFKRRIDQAEAEITLNKRTIETLQFQRDMGGQFKVIDEGSIPQPASDRRPVFAAIGFVGGAAVPIGFLLLLGLANPRYRFSDETNTESIGLNLLGILPDLPDRLSDPEQASIAAHCVHQIRTMLQISGGTEERRVFAVTSAAPGDGKTSLTLALGLSYAACGTRTLLIDCDLVGAGLTSRMNVNAPEGVLEAIANRSLLEYVRRTDVADVSILPVGSAQTLHASTLSPAALRRLIDEARKQYDTILIDTGPILGSIEASLVCAAADAVVLTVARGQQRPLVEKSIGHLMNIGAKLAGVVFNRAQANDFDRSISGVSSLRSVASGSGHNGHDGPRYGTLGRAVHSSARQSDINEG